MLQRSIDADGDHTIRSSVMDIARKLDWPERYTARVLHNAFTRKWHQDIPGLLANAQEESDRWKSAWQSGDVDIANTFVGEGTGLINSIESAETILETMSADAQALLAARFSY